MSNCGSNQGELIRIRDKLLRAWICTDPECETLYWTSIACPSAFYCPVCGKKLQKIDFMDKKGR